MQWMLTDQDAGYWESRCFYLNVTVPYIHDVHNDWNQWSKSGHFIWFTNNYVLHCLSSRVLAEQNTVTQKSFLSLFDRFLWTELPPHPHVLKSAEAGEGGASYPGMFGKAETACWPWSHWVPSATTERSQAAILAIYSSRQLGSWFRAWFLVDFASLDHSTLQHSGVTLV